MSLTSLLHSKSNVKTVLKRISPSKEYFRSNTPFPAFSNENPLLVPWELESAGDAGLIGRAADYMFRFIVAKTVDQKKEEAVEDLCAEKGLNMIQWERDDSFTVKIQKQFNEGVSTIRSFIYGELTDYIDIAKISLLFSYLEMYCRSGALPTRIEDIIERRDPAMLNDIVALAKQFEIDFIDSGIVNDKSDVVYNPEFGKWSKLCGGADADIYIDGVLYDFKCTKRIYKDWNEIGQVYGYYLLYKLCQKDDLYVEIPWIKKPIDAIAIYKARYGLINKCIIKESDADYSIEALMGLQKAIEVDGTAQHATIIVKKDKIQNVTTIQPVHTMELTQRNFKMNLEKYKKGIRVYAPYIGFGKIELSYNTKHGTVFIIESDKAKKFQCNANEFCRLFMVIHGNKLVIEGNQILHLENGLGKVTKIEKKDNYSILHVTFKNNRKKIINSDSKDWFVAERPIPQFNSIEDFPYRIGETVVFNRQKTVLISEFESVEGRNYIVLQSKEGEKKPVNAIIAALFLYEEKPRNDMALLDACTKKSILVNDEIHVGDGIVYCFNNKKEQKEGTVSKIDKNEKGVLSITIEFETNDKEVFLGAEFHSD